MEQVRIPSGGVRIAGDLHIPEGMRAGERRPGLVLGHGFGILKQSLVTPAEHFRRAGYVTLAIDYRTFGESEGNRGGSSFRSTRWRTTATAISYLQTRPEVDPEQIGIWGASFGGAVVIWTAAVDRRVKAVVSEVPGGQRAALDAGAVHERGLGGAAGPAGGGPGAPLRNGRERTGATDAAPGS